MDLLLVYQYTTQNLFLSLLGLKKIKLKPLTVKYTWRAA